MTEQPRSRTALLFAGGVLAAVVSAIGAQAPQVPPPAPNTLGQPLLDPAGHVREDAFFKVPVSPEDRKYADIDGLRMKAVLLETIAISQNDRASGALFWGRNVGFKGHADTQDWVEAYFRKHGLKDVRRKSFDLAPQWVPASYDISFSSGGRTFGLTSARPAEDSASTPAGGIELDLVWVGTGTAADFAGREVKGKAVLIQDIPAPGVLRHSIATEGAVQRALANGAVAVGMMYGISDNFAL